MKKMKTTFKRIVLFGMVLFCTGIYKPALAQIPAEMESDMDNLNAIFYEALKIIDTETEQDALKQLASIKPKIEAKAKAYAARWEGTELSEEDEIALGKKMLEKQLYKDMYALMGKPSFQNKIENSPSLKKEYNLLMSYLDEDDEGEEEENPE